MSGFFFILGQYVFSEDEEDENRTGDLEKFRGTKFHLSFDQADRSTNEVKKVNLSCGRYIAQRWCSRLNLDSVYFSLLFMDSREIEPV